MRVCFYTETALPMVGGQELAIDALARGFQNAGHAALVLTLRSRGGQPSGDRALPYPVRRHRRYVSTRHLLDLYRGAISAAYRHFPFDVLHCHNVYPAGYVAARWARGRGIPLILTSHGCDIAPDSHLLRKRGVADKVAYVLSRTDAVVAIGDGVAGHFEQHGFRREKIARIPNGVHLAEFSRPTSRPAELDAAIQPHRFVLFIGRMVERKGADLLLKAMPLLRNQHDLCAVLAGTGPEWAGLRSLAETLGVDQRVHFTGVASGAMKRYLLQNSLCTVLPSRISEGASLVVLESYAAGRPVIGTAVPGLVEAVDHGRTGLLVPPESPAALAEALATIAADPAAAARMGAHARNVAQDYDWSRIVHQHLGLYQSLVSSPAQRKVA